MRRRRNCRTSEVTHALTREAMLSMVVPVAPPVVAKRTVPVRDRIGQRAFSPEIGCQVGDIVLGMRMGGVRLSG